MIPEDNPGLSRRKFIAKVSLVSTALAVPFQGLSFIKPPIMKDKTLYDAIIVGGSYSGLAAAMALGRALKQVLIIDNGKPCNAQTPYSHNFLTQDGNTPAGIAALAFTQVESYENVKFYNGLATTGRKTDDGFEIRLATGEAFRAGKLIFATGIRDIMPAIEGFAECWGISVIHCPYCHGYEVRGLRTGILANGEQAFDVVRLISNWTKDLTVFTNGKTSLSDEHSLALEEHQITIIEKEIQKLEHINGHINTIFFKDGTKSTLSALYAPRPFEPHSMIPETLGCELTEEGYIKTNALQETSVPGIYACGDNSTRMRTVANAVAMGTAAGMSASKKIILDQFQYTVSTKY
ncbi:NAD(P)/FAD-dependent oxidoreductase [Flavobacterium cerinum]|uniref:NAD(P)/FAD-dependent oxidoreductase n=1 Tax=Flavobacterium cerinum TaxID=2502784 RepID=A0A444HCE9_9FLAO|nr:NAD(P)/FAD-dependent oxidoreductase [Flavobacterium cerinum]RWX01379.1 NAD(P)/FAD-dependent oxidoreductase [Flavobacterium cerinum]